jgi:hypothetical protein
MSESASRQISPALASAIKTVRGVSPPDGQRPDLVAVSRLILPFHRY